MAGTAPSNGRYASSPEPHFCGACRGTPVGSAGTPAGTKCRADTSGRLSHVGTWLEPPSGLVDDLARSCERRSRLGCSLGFWDATQVSEVVRPEMPGVPFPPRHLPSPVLVSPV